jgi:hypothetical protein
LGCQTTSIAAILWYFARFSCSKAGLLRRFWQERPDGPDLGRQMRVLTVIKSEKIARGPFQSRSALVHTPRTQGHLPGSPSQEASGRDRSAPSGVGQIRFGVGFLQGAQWFIAGWSSPVARQAHNLKVIGSNPIPATTFVITHSPSRSNRRDGLAFLGNAGVTEQVQVRLWSEWTGARPFWEKVTGSNHVRRAISVPCRTFA